MVTSWSSASTSEPSPVLVHRDRVVCECEVARERSARRRGLLGRDGLDGALALPGVRSVHTFGMRFAIDAAFVARDGEVLRIVTLPPGRVSRVVWRAASTIEAAAGAFAAWGVGAGDRIEVR
jgi:hypothetical protein